MDDPCNIDQIAKREAAYLMRHWYLHPDFSPAGSYDGIHFGECSEFVCYRQFVRIIKLKLLNAPAIIKKMGSFRTGERLYLKWHRISPLSAANHNGRSRRINDNGSSKPTILVSYLRQNIALLKALSECGQFDLVIEINEESDPDLLARAGIRHENFNDFIVPEVRSASEIRFKELLPLWMNSLESPSFQDQFAMGETSFFTEARDVLEGVFREQFLSAIVTVETFKKIADQRRLALVLSWSDFSPLHRTLALTARQMGIPFLHVAHAIHGMDPTNETVYADRVAVYGDFSRDMYLSSGNPPEKIVVTGNPDWDKYKSIMPSLRKDDICSVLGLDPKKRTILFATFWLAGPTSPIDPSLVERFYRALLRTISDISRYHKVQLAVKLHPSECDRKGWYRKIAIEEGMEDLVIEASRLEALLMVSDVVVCRASNIGFEALLLGKPVISYGSVFYGEKKAVLVINDFSELDSAVEKCLFDSAFRKGLEQHRKEAVLRYNYLSDGKATLRIMGVIEEMTGVKVTLPNDFVPFIGGFLLGKSQSAGEAERSFLNPLIEEGDAAAHKGDLKTALSTYRNALEKDPSLTGLLNKIGRVQLKAGMIDEAIETLTGSIRKEPELPEGYLLLSLSLYYKGRFDEALNCLQSVIDMGSSAGHEKAMAHFYAGNCKKAMGNPEGAQESYQRSLLLDPDSKETLKKLGNLYFEAGRLDMARGFFQRVVDRDAHDAEAINDLAVVLFRLGSVREAKLSLRKALEIRPEYLDALLNLAEIETDEGNHKEALTLLENCVSIHPGNQRAVELHDMLRQEREEA